VAVKFAQGEFLPQNAKKYIGKHPITYRSSWELTMMRVLDEHAAVIAWASESISIPYRNPLTGKWSMYIPDLLVVYADRNGHKHAEIVEIKPLRERPDYQPKPKERLSQHTKAAQIVNAAKWAAAVQYCAKNNLRFRVASEDEMFAYRRKK
jgi:hypothetical protein